MVAPAERASSWNSARDASKSRSTGGSAVGGGVSGRSSALEASRSEMDAAARACWATLEGRKRSEVNSTATRTALSRDVPWRERKRFRSTASRFALALDTGLMGTLPWFSHKQRPPDMGGSASYWRSQSQAAGSQCALVRQDDCRCACLRIRTGGR